jgi:hypothetical protein
MNPTYLIWQAEHWNDGLNTAARTGPRAELAMALSLRRRRRRCRAASVGNFVQRAVRVALVVASSLRGTRPAPAAADGMEVC